MTHCFSNVVNHVFDFFLHYRDRISYDLIACSLTLWLNFVKCNHDFFSSGLWF
jgi:hypothetical protein